MRWPAPAKLNLFLHVCGRRPDGYHELQTLFQLIDFCDELEFRPRADGQVSRTNVVPGIAEDEDLVVRAARLLQAASSTHVGASITLHKNIPTGAGLGGGSSDAATTLLVLNHLWGCGLSAAELAGLGLQLGADVPLFIHGHTAFGRGVGEQLRPVSLGPRHYLLVMLPVHVSTAEVFRHPHLRRDSPRLADADLPMGVGDNCCEPVVRSLYPEIAAALDDVRRFGPARMTGTGSSIFLEMPDEQAALKASFQLNSLYNVRAVRGQDRSPLHEMLQYTAWTGRGWQAVGTSPSW
jgi:4-diphosphocytidyl-2-C-methyl-D-erythritol kinase